MAAVNGALPSGGLARVMVDQLNRTYHAHAKALHWHRQLRLSAEDMRRLEGMFKDQVYYGAMQAAEQAIAAANTRGAKGTECCQLWRWSFGTFGIQSDTDL